MRMPQFWTVFHIGIYRGNTHDRQGKSFFFDIADIQYTIFICE